MEELKITDLQPKILEKIFSYLSFFEVKKLTEVCKRFNDIIGSSFKIMNSVYIVWNEEQNILMSQRNYQNIKIRNAKEISTNLLMFVENHLTSLNCIMFNRCTLDVSEFATFMRVVSNNLETLKLCTTKFFGDYLKIPLRMPKLKKITISNGDKSTALISNCFYRSNTVEEFLYYYNDKTVKRLLCSLSAIKKLTFGNNSDKIFDDNYMATHATFHLEALKLNMRTIHDTNFIDFLNTQKNSLKKVKFVDSRLDGKIIEALFGMKHLEKIYLKRSYFLFRQKLSVKSTSITKLFIVRKSLGFEKNEDYHQTEEICSIIKNCPNLQELDLRCVAIKREFSLIISNELKCLSEIKFENCYLLPMTYPTVKAMIFRSMCNYDIILQHLQANQQLKELVLPWGITSHGMYEETMKGLILDKLSFI